MLKFHRQTIVQALGRHTIHPFPARMAPGIALDALSGRESLRVLDPMAGSGTVLAVARAKGHRAYGYDLDPLAVLLSTVWTHRVEPLDVQALAEEVLSNAKKTFRKLSSAKAYPDCADEETKTFLRFWFDDYARAQLASLSRCITKVEDESARRLLWCAFSKLIIAKKSGASLAMDLSHSRPHRAFRRAPVKPFNKFLSAVESIARNCPQKGTGKLGPESIVRLGDARKLSLPSNSIDLVLTSPPYLNAIDYMRCSKFSLVWMGYNLAELRRVRGISIGAEGRSDESLEVPWVREVVRDLRLKPKLSARDENLLHRYVWDMGRAVSEVARVLTLGGRAVYVVGDSTVRGTFVPNSSVVQIVAEQRGLLMHSRHSRTLPANRRYLPPPKKGLRTDAMDDRMRREVVLVFDKPIQCN